jgi:hypothetical protein
MLTQLNPSVFAVHVSYVGEWLLVLTWCEKNIISWLEASVDLLWEKNITD